MEEKYEFVDDDTVITSNGDILRRIRATRAIEGVVKKGDLGGYIGSRFNLSHSDNAWVSGNARVFGEASVSDRARVSGEARVCGRARVSGNAQIFDRGHIFLASVVDSESDMLTVYNGKNDTLLVTLGDFSGTAEKFLAAVNAKHDERIRREYALLIEVAKSRIEHVNHQISIELKR